MPDFDIILPQIASKRKKLKYLQRVPKSPLDPDTREFAQWQTLDGYTSDLANILKAAFRIPDPDFALAKDPRAFDKIRRDAKIMAFIMYRKHMIGGKFWFFSPGDNRSSSMVPVYERIFQRITNLPTAIFRLADATFTGLAIEKMVGRVDWFAFSASDFTGGNPPTGIGEEETQVQLWYPWKLRDIDKRRVKKEWAEVGPGKREYYWTIFNPEDFTWRAIEDRTAYIWHEYNDEEDTFGYGRGLFEPIYYYWHAKVYLLAYAQQYLETFGKPYVKAKIGSGVGQPRNFAARTQKMINVVRQMLNQRILIVGSDDDVDFMKLDASSFNTLLDLINYLDDAIALLTIGSNVFTNIRGPGAGKQKEVETDLTQTYVNYDRLLMEQTINRDMVSQIYENNKPQFAAMGLDGMRPPMFQLQPQRVLDPNEQVKLVQAGVLLGLEFKKDEVYSRLGFTKPEPGDDSITKEDLPESGNLPSLPA